METEAIKLGENNHSEYNWSNNTKDKLTQLFFLFLRTSNTDAINKIKAGASLLQLYTGFVYGGPGLVKQINNAILNYRLNQ